MKYKNREDERICKSPAQAWAGKKAEKIKQHKKRSGKENGEREK